MNPLCPAPRRSIRITYGLQNMSLAQCPVLLGARWRLPALVLVFVVGSEFAVSLMLPRQDTATVPARINSKSHPLAPDMFAGMPPPVSISTREAQFDVESPLTAGPYAAQGLLAHLGELRGYVVETAASRLETRPSQPAGAVLKRYRS